MTHARLVVCCLAVALALAGCSNKRKIAPPDKLWSTANEAYDSGAYDLAIDNYKALLDQHPFDPNAEEAELRIAQSYYNASRYPEAIAAFADFERKHPTSPNLAEVEYQIGLANLAQTSTTDRDQQPTVNAQAYFKNVIDRFPQSPWAERSRLRLRECREALATSEADVAQYYLRHKNLRAGEARLSYLLTEYPETDATAQALYRFAEWYADREENEGATLALATIVRHHPDHPLSVDARERLGDGMAEADGTDPLPRLVAHIANMQAEPDRQKLPTTVSAYPDTGNTSGERR
jgi:outer membrane protein assembly factor BamD